MRWRPSYVLALRAVLGYAVAALSPAADAAPPPLAAWIPVQRALDLAMTTALGVHQWIPKRILYCPIASGGFGVPSLATLVALRHLHLVFRATTSRNSLVAGVLRHLLAQGHLDHPGASLFRALCQRWDLKLLFPSSGQLRMHQPTVNVVRPYAGGPVLLISDGSVSGDALGWGHTATLYILFSLVITARPLWAAFLITVPCPMPSSMSPEAQHVCNLPGV